MRGRVRESTTTLTALLEEKEEQLDADALDLLYIYAVGDIADQLTLGHSLDASPSNVSILINIAYDRKLESRAKKHVKHRYERFVLVTSRWLRRVYLDRTRISSTFDDKPVKISFRWLLSEKNIIRRRYARSFKEWEYRDLGG